MQQFVKFVCHLLIRNLTTLLWFVSGVVREALGYRLWHLSNVECATFSRQKALQSLDFGTLQGGTLRHGHQSAALLVEEKRHTCRHVFNFLQFDCCIIFDAYHIYERTSLQTFWKLSFYPLATFSTYRPAIT